MQLRVARLCLDCEELHVEDLCPICASERFAYLSAWLPSEERRRWRKAAPRQPAPPPHGFAGLMRRVAAWLSGIEDHERPPVRTRASDHVPSFDLDSPAPERRKPQAIEPRAAGATSGRRDP